MKTRTKQTKKITFLFAVNHNDELDSIKATAAIIFGGYSLTTLSGGWTDAGGKLLEEKSYKLETITDKESRNFDNLAQHIAKIARQDEVYYFADTITLTNLYNNKTK